MKSRGLIAALISLALLSGLAIVACGEDSEKIGDGKIIDRLNLEKAEGGETLIFDDTFCEVEAELLNTRDEIDSAEEESDLNLVVTSREGNVGVEGVPVFTDDCRAEARKRLSRLDRPDE